MTIANFRQLVYILVLTWYKLYMCIKLEKFKLVIQGKKELSVAVIKYFSIENFIYSYLFSVTGWETFSTFNHAALQGGTKSASN